MNAQGQIYSTMKLLESPQKTFHCKSMQISYDAHWQLTQQSEVDSTLSSNSPKSLWLSLLPERMMKIQSKMKALEWSQHYPLIFKILKGS